MEGEKKKLQLPVTFNIGVLIGAAYCHIRGSNTVCGYNLTKLCTTVGVLLLYLLMTV